jgi:phosphinothricin acetyltransferase
VHHEWHQRGIGALLLKELVRLARSVGHHAVIAVIDADQIQSVNLHAKFGFEKAGHLKHVGYKFDCWRDVIYMELML